MNLQIPDHPFEGYIFDCDGTIADTMPIHYVAWQLALGELGAEFSEERHYEWGGMPNREIIRRLNEEQGLAMDPVEVVRRKHKHYLDRVHEVKPVEPVLQMARQFHGTAPMAVASGGLRELVLSTLGALGVVELFDAIVCADDYQKGKPDPEPFLLAASRIGVEPPKCLVFEDTPLGVEAARRAGMQFVLVPTIHNQEFREKHLSSAASP